LLHQRKSTPNDYETIAAFPQSREEAFYMFPRGQYPLTAEQLEVNGASRFSHTAILDGDTLVGYGNLYDVSPGSHAFIGNIMVRPANRRSGTGTFLLRTLIGRAVEEHAAQEIRLVVHNTNTRAMLLYIKLGFKPYDTGVTTGPDGSPMVRIMMSLSGPELFKSHLHYIQTSFTAE